MLVDAALINLLEVEKLSRVIKCSLFATVNIWTKGHEVHTAVFLFCVVCIYFMYLTMLSAPRDT